MTTDSSATGAQQIAAGYAFEGSALELGTVVVDGVCDPTAQVRNPGEQVHRIERVGEAAARGRVMVFDIQDGVVAAMWSGPLDAADTDEICS